MSDLSEAMCDFANHMKEAAISCAKMWAEIVKSAKEIEKWMQSAIEYSQVERAATPNERRMMHNKRKRIRKKYYNRVKRRLGL